MLLMPHILLAGVLLGMFHWTNYWDFVIYFVVAGGVILFANIVMFRGKASGILAVTAAQAAEMLVISTAVILPFTLKFETMVQGVALAKNHSLPHQLLILWGLPAILTFLFVIILLWEKLRGADRKTPYHFLAALKTPDMFAVILGLCAAGLVLIPELVYVRDIYENGNARANTMFKLTYQAYIMFAMTMVYVLFRFLAVFRRKWLKAVGRSRTVPSGMDLGIFRKQRGFPGSGMCLIRHSIRDLTPPRFLKQTFRRTAAGIRWLKNNVEGSPVVLEANGDSYTQYERVSAMTGLPTVLGWYVHEWLWRNDVADLNARAEDVETIYTSGDSGEIRELLEKYEVALHFYRFLRT